MQKYFMSISFVVNENLMFVNELLITTFDLYFSILKALNVA